ncbi:SpoIIE family protein phosphatase [Georgenia satyanarayanai]|uniref:SpoIIE family protein phosphatase n=1 Tax=Georgenia satyanarayanai TaxID=860221 RepID=UPI00126448D2|nr:SpoIIE family protein phosphatase [Georgenia satyanarayanai]
MADDLTLAPDVPVDLDNCAREPIHVPGSVQPRGVLLVLHDGVVVQASASTAELLGRDVDDVLGSTLVDVVGTAAADAVTRHTQLPGDVRDRNPLLVRLPDGREWDAIVHHPPGAEQLLGLELEPADGPRPLSYANTFQLVRGSLSELNRARSLDELYDVTAREVRTLTGFDRVMVYRFDASFNGEVVAEAKRPDLNAFHGLHYPATDIPAQARALYELNWIRLISDIGYTPSPLVPPLNPVTAAPLDLTYATLRSVSPIHIEYLQNMGVTASMSISLLKDGKLWGLIACHHYSGQHAPPYGIRAAAEFLGSVLSLRLVAQVEEDRISAVRRVAHDLAGLVAASRDEDLPLTEALAQHPALLPIMEADGAIVRAQGRTACVGQTPPAPEAVLAWAAASGREVTSTDSLSADVGAGVAAGALAVNLADGDAVIWLRREVATSVDWGGDPHNKAIARREGDSVRLSPRKSFERWREIVRGSSPPWTDDQLDTATVLRRHAVEALYLRGLADSRAAEVLHRSSLPTALPRAAGWEILARYAPGDGGRVGGDWYDALCLPDGRLAVAVGDVAGHGMPAASTMGQMRNALRALLVRDSSAAAATTGLDELAKQTMAGEMATLLLAVIDTVSGRMEYVRAGHLPPLFVDPDGGARWNVDPGALPIGYGRGEPVTQVAHIPRGGGVVLYTDGLVERRGQPLPDGLERLRLAFSGPVATDLDALITAVRDPRSDDDATAVVLRRA